MPCLNSDGQLSETAQRILSAMENPLSLSQVAAATGLPFYRIRSASRELAEAGFAAEAADKWQITSTGLAAIRKTGTVA